MNAHRANGRRALALFAGLAALVVIQGPALAQVSFQDAASAGVASTAAIAAPTFQAAGAAIGGTGSVTPAWPAHAAGDIGLLICESAGGQPPPLATPHSVFSAGKTPHAP